MNTQSIKKEHNYHTFIQDFFYLFDKIKNESDPIYNARAGFHVAKFLIKDSKNFLIKHRNWNWDERVNKACEVIFRKCNKTKEANQELQEEAKGILNEYIYENAVKEVSIHGNHASIELKDNKKEFKISEFLNSDFCQKNGVLGFSTLHSDGKSGMHGFVAEEGGKKIRHYVVIDGSYEMTLNWHDKNGKKCTIKINIDKDGVDLTERNGVTEEQLKANSDVKIGGLFLHEIQFREKGQEQEQSFEILERNLHNNRIPPVHNSRSENDLYNNRTPSVYNSRSENDLYNNRIPLVYNSPFEDDFLEENLDNNRTPSVYNSRSENDLYNNRTPLVYNSRSENNLHKNRTPPPTPPRATPKASEQTFVNHGGGQRDKQNLANSPAFTKSVIQNQNDREKDERYTSTTFGNTISGDQRSDRNEHILDNQQQKRTPPPTPLRTSSLKKDIFDAQTPVKPVSEDVGQKDERSTFTTFGHTASGSQKLDRSEQENSISGQGKTQQQNGNIKSDLFQDIRSFKKNNSWYADVDKEKDKRPTFTTFGYTTPGSKKNEQENSSNQQQDENSRKALLQDIRNFEENNLRHIDIDDRAEKNRENNPWKKLKDELPYLPFSDMHEHNSDNQGASDAEWEESEQLFSVTPKNKSGSAPTRDKSHEQSKKSLENIEQKEIGQEAGLLKDNAAETKINDSGYSSPTYTSHYNFQVNPEQLEKRLETIESKKEDASELLEKLNKGFREPSQQATKDLFSESMLEEIKEGKQYDPIRKLLERKVAEQENDNTNLTVDKNSELYKLLEKDAAQLKAGVIEEEKEDTLTERNDSPDRNRVALANKNRKLLWTKCIAEQQEKDDGISI